MKRYLVFALSASMSIFGVAGLTGCEVEEEGELPEVEVDVEEGEMPETDMKDVDVETEEVELDVPTIDVEDDDEPETY
jgi:hypothetical protein